MSNAAIAVVEFTAIPAVAIVFKDMTAGVPVEIYVAEAQALQSGTNQKAKVEHMLSVTTPTSGDNAELF